MSNATQLNATGLPAVSLSFVSQGYVGRRSGISVDVYDDSMAACNLLNGMGEGGAEVRRSGRGDGQCRWGEFMYCTK
jgi:hypothetical protein